MAEYIEREALIKLAKTKHFTVVTHKRRDAEAVQEAVQEQGRLFREAVDECPAVDAVEVVRCKDCKFFKYGDYCTESKMEHSLCRENDFCSYGERIEQ